MEKAFIVLSVICLGLFASPEVLPPLAATTASTQASSISADITKLIVNKHGDNLDFNSTIKIINNANNPITLDQHYTCGFGIKIIPRTDYDISGIGYNSKCEQINAINPFTLTYNPGSSYEYYNASYSFLFTGFNAVDIPEGFYYFKIDTSFSSLNGINVENALFLYFGNNTSLINYNVTSADLPTNSNLPISAQISLYTNLANNKNISDLNQLLAIFAFLTVILLEISIILYNNRRKRKKLLHGNQDFKLQIKEDIKNLDQSTVKNFCPTCHVTVNSGDIFCQNCGQDLE